MKEKKACLVLARGQRGWNRLTGRRLDKTAESVWVNGPTQRMALLKKNIKVYSINFGNKLGRHSEGCTGFTGCKDYNFKVFIFVKYRDFLLNNLFSFLCISITVSTIYWCRYR